MIDLNYLPGEAQFGEVDIDSDYESLNGEDLVDLAEGIDFVGEAGDDNVNGADPNAPSPNREYTPVSEPAIGQSFESPNDFESHMHAYAYSKGFCIRTKCRDKADKSYKPKKVGVARNRGEIDPNIYRRIRLVCNLQGLHQPIGNDVGKQIQSGRCDCGCQFTAWRQHDGSWKVTKAVLTHNHELDPDIVRFMNRYRGISTADEYKMLLLQRAGLRSSQIYAVFIIQYGEIKDVPFSEKDMRNLLSRKSLLEMKEGDYKAMQRLFQKMQANSSDFYYNHDTDELGRVKSIFWADGRGRKAFQDFGDVVSFDTTYLSNRYKMPFSPFIGVNHHGQSILFGCALIAKDDAENFTWLFKEWMTCMGNKAPKCILTDQCKAIAKAVADVFPNTRHRWCIWHILRNMRKYFGTMTEWENIARSLRRILHESLSIQEFETEWFAWAEKYGILGKQWCIDKFQIRARWVPIYFKHEFWAGMSSTQRSEGMNNFFKGYVSVNTTLQVFVEEYAKALAKREEDEERENYASLNRPYMRMTEFGFEAVFHDMYTNCKFREFQKQLKDMMFCNAMVIKDDGMRVVYEVKTNKVRKGRTSRRYFLVHVQRKPWDISCECKNFEFRGIICCHMLQVFKVEDQQEVPQKFIIDRWRKDICREYTKVTCPYGDVMKEKKPEPKKRYDTMESKFQIISSRAMMNPESFNKVMEVLGQLQTDLVPEDNLPPGLTKNAEGNIVKQWGSAARNGETSARVGSTGEREGPLDPVDQRKRGKARSHRLGYQVDERIKKKQKKKKKKNVADDAEAEAGNYVVADLNLGGYGWTQ